MPDLARSVSTAIMAVQEENPSRETSFDELDTVRLAKPILDSLSSHIAILSHDGSILTVNESWRKFAIENPRCTDRPWPDYNYSEGANYLRVCDDAVGINSEESKAVAAGIRAVIDGERDIFSIEYPCHSPTARRWFRLRATAFPGSGEARAVVSHENITERKLAERIAETLQRAMLQSSPISDQFGIKVETLYEPALHEAQVGGDFYDTFALDSKHVALVVGDVSGKGLAAAERTTEVKYALRTLLHEHLSPELVLPRLNEFICTTHDYGQTGGETFIVLALVVIDSATGEAKFSAAGSEPTVILRKDGRIELSDVFGMPLGIQREECYAVDTRMLYPGDTLLMATDGITEARRGSKFLGIDGLSSLAAQSGSAIPLDQLCQTIYHGVRDFASGNLADDVCLLLARR